MDSSFVFRRALLLGVAGLGLTSPVSAQSDALMLRFDAGLATPFGEADDYFDPGPSFSAEVVYPWRPRLALIGTASVDMLNNNAFWPVPDTRLWRYQVGVEADLLGALSENYGIRLFGLVGGSSMESDPFLTEDDVEYPAVYNEVMQTYLAGSGGIRFGFGLSSILSGWLTGQVNWTPADEDRLPVLHQAVNETLEPVGRATTASVRLGFSYRLGDGP